MTRISQHTVDLFNKVAVSAPRNEELYVIALQPSSRVLCLLNSRRCFSIVLSAHDPSGSLRRGDYNIAKAIIKTQI
eukprot:1947596-Pleurochrysis_carterae.AAC.1